ncbi:hypothetical protein [Lacipirellula sp.]|uniref:hypothetical protein n=1 Tax=Lacipirellula sp. TaxID=2691419 RepID=UPI003D0B5F5B
MRRFVLWCAAILCVSSTASAAVRNSFMLNEANAVTGSKFLESNKFDTALGRLQGNGQNWLEFITVQGDELGGGKFKNTLDLRGWKFEWAYDKQDPADPNQYGSGTITFTNDPLWAAVPVGTMLTINEWKQAWYQPGSDLNGGLDRMGGIAGLGQQRGEDYNPAVHTLKDFSTNVGWNPLANGGGAAGDWNINIWAGEQNPDNSFKYFNFTGSVVNGDPNNPLPIGSGEAGLYAVNNDSWQWTIKDAAGNIVQGPLGETGTGVTAVSPITGQPVAANWSVNSQEIVRLEGFAVGSSATQQKYLDTWLNNYQDGSSSSFGEPNIWSSGSGVQDLSPLRSWLKTGDADLDGVVDGSDFLAWQRGFGKAQPSLTDGDLNGDGVVDGADLAVWRGAFGAAGTVAVAAVPECSTACLAAMAAVGFIRRRRRQ